MSKATEMARVSARGGFNLMWGLVISTVISSVGTIVIARLLGAGNYGLYTIAFTAPNLISVFRDWGVNSAMVKYSAQYNNQVDATKIRGVFLSGLVFEVIVGSALSLLCFLISPFLAELFHRPTIVPLIQVISLIILTGGLINSATAAFTGMETMHLNSIMLIVQSVVKTALIVGLVALGLGSMGATIGFATASLIAGLTGLLLVFTLYRSLPKSAKRQWDIYLTIKTLFSYGLPLSIAAVLTTFLSYYYALLLPIYVTNNSLIGNYNLAVLFSVLITFFATPVTTMMFPAFSKLDPEKDHETLKNVFQYSVKYAALIVVPVTALVISLAQPGIGTIFAKTYAEAPLFLALSSLIYVLSAFGSLSTPNLLNGQGYTTYNMKLSILTAAIGFPVGFVLISRFGVIGLILTSLVVTIPSTFIGLDFVKKRFGVSLDWMSSAKILFSSAVGGIITYFLVSELAYSNPVKLVIGIIAFIIVFSFVALLSGTIKRADLANLRAITFSLGTLRGPLVSAINFVERIMDTLHLEG